MTNLFFNPHRLLTVLAVSALALLPAIVHLAWVPIAVTHPALAAGPLLAGLALAPRFTVTRLGFASLGTFLATLIWMANWLMMAGGNCCSTMGH